MELDVRLDKDSLTIIIHDPFKLELEDILVRINSFLSRHGDQLNGLDLAGLLPRMVRGIAGCEAGCPSDAMGVVSKGHPNFKIEYIEGGILTATARTRQDRTLSLRLFPDF